MNEAEPMRNNCDSMTSCESSCKDKQLSFWQLLLFHVCIQQIIFAWRILEQDLISACEDSFPVSRKGIYCSDFIRNGEGQSKRRDSHEKF